MSNPVSTVDPIPTPPSLRWREFRHTLLPSLVFTAVLAVCAVIWSKYVTAPTLVGEVEFVRANVVSTQPGRLARLAVVQFAPVRAGDLIAEVMVTDPKLIESTLAVIRAEVQVLIASSSTALDVERGRVDYQRLRLEWLDQRALLATARVRLQYAQSELDRLTRLYQVQGQATIATRQDYEIAVRDQAELEQEVAARERIVREVESGLQGLKQLADSASPGTELQKAAINLQEQQLRKAESELGPVILSAPIDGTVGVVFRQSGENVLAGEPIVTIVSENSSRILSYAIPPTQAPVVGASVEVIARTAKRERALGKITHVAGHMDIVQPTLFNPINSNARGLGNQQLSPGTRPIELGIPVAISMPVGLHLRPGELVDLRVLTADN